MSNHAETCSDVHTQRTTTQLDGAKKQKKNKERTFCKLFTLPMCNTLSPELSKLT